MTAPTAAPTLRPRALGLDLSLQSTGVASSLGWCDRIRPAAAGSPNRNMRGLERLRWITARIRDLATEYDLAVIEGPSFGSKYGSPHERGGLWWMVRDVVDGAGIPVAVAPPSSVKLWATGSGGASKDAVKAAMRARYPHVRIRNSDEADALAMADLGAAWLADGPLSDIQQRAVKGVAWPEKEVTLR